MSCVYETRVSVSRYSASVSRLFVSSQKHRPAGTVSCRAILLLQRQTLAYSRPYYSDIIPVFSSQILYSLNRVIKIKIANIVRCLTVRSQEHVSTP